MARLQIKVLHDPGDPADGIILVQDGKEVKLAAGETNTYNLQPGGLAIKTLAVDTRGVPLGNQASPAATPGMSRTDPRPAQGQHQGGPGGGQTSTDGRMPHGANQPKEQPVTPPTQVPANAGAVNPGQPPANPGGVQSGSQPPANPPARQGAQTANSQK